MGREPGELVADIATHSLGPVRATIPLLAFFALSLGVMAAVLGQGAPTYAPLILGTTYCLLFCGLWIASQDRGDSGPTTVPVVQIALALTWSNCLAWILLAPSVCFPALIAAAVVSVCVVEWSELIAAGVWAASTCVVAGYSSLELIGAAAVYLGAACVVTLAVGVRAARARAARLQAEAAEAAREREEGESAADKTASKAESAAVAAAQAAADATAKILEVHGEVDGLWEWDLKADRVHFSPRWRELLDYQDGPFSGVPADWFNLVHPYDLEEFMSRIRAHIEGESDRFEFEHRVRQADDSYRWVLSHGRVIFDESGVPDRLAGSQVDLKRTKEYEARLIHQAAHDSLTGLPNRDRLREILHEECARSQKEHAPMVVVAFIDLDDFKQINDTLGHKVGDDLLRGVARRLSETVGPEHAVARLSGDEFVLVLRDQHEEREAVDMVQKAADALREPFQCDGEEILLTISVGVTLTSEKEITPGEVLGNANIAMRHAKRHGKGRVQMFDEGMGLKASRRFELQARLRHAFENRRFELFYQPIVSASDGQIVCAEALMRWRTRDGEIVSPGEFIPIVEEMDLIHDLGRWALEDACEQAMEWQKKGLPEIEVSVNVSVKQLARADLADAVKAILKRTGLKPRLLQLELTESDLVETRYSVSEVLDRFTLLGVKTAIDDFGTGYSSLSYLRNLRCDVLKIDRSFVCQVDADSTDKSAAIIRSIVGLAQNLELGVVAEGVETQPQIDFLREAGCQRLQGYFAGKPMPASELEELMRAGGRFPLRGLEAVAPLPPRSENRAALSAVSS